MKFLVPTDFSDNAFHAAMYAVALAKAKPGSSIHLLHVLTPVIHDPVLIHDIEEEATKSINKLSTDLKSRCSSCEISHTVVIGDTLSEINKAAKALNTGMIVTGIQGLGNTRRFFFGSNTRSMVDKAVCPVIVVPESSVFKAPEKIVFATDYYDSDLEALQRLVPVAAAFNSEIVMVHIYDESDEEQSELIMMNFITNEVFKTVDYPRITYRVYYNESTSQGLKTFSELTGADLIVLSARKQNLFQKLFSRSVTKDLTYNSGVPLLIFHVHKTGDPDFL